MNGDRIDVDLGGANIQRLAEHEEELPEFAARTPAVGTLDNAVGTGRELFWSVTATAGMPMPASVLTSGLIRTRPSTSEYSVCRRR